MSDQTQTITKHVWPDGVQVWTLSIAGDVTGFFWSYQTAADFANGKTIQWAVQHHDN